MLFLLAELTRCLASVGLVVGACRLAMGSLPGPAILVCASGTKISTSATHVETTFPSLRGRCRHGCWRGKQKLSTSLHVGGRHSFFEATAQFNTQPPPPACSSSVLIGPCGGALCTDRELRQALAILCTFPSKCVPSSLLHRLCHPSQRRRFLEPQQ